MTERNGGQCAKYWRMNAQRLRCFSYGDSMMNRPDWKKDDQEGVVEVAAVNALISLTTSKEIVTESAAD